MAALAHISIRQSPTDKPQWMPATWADYIAACQTAEAQEAENFQVYTVASTESRVRGG